MAIRQDFTIEQGATFNFTLNYLEAYLAVASISGITNSGQAVVTATAHGIPTDWAVFITGVVGMEINHQPRDLQRPDKMYTAYFVDANTVRLAVDSTRLGTYVSGGELLYHPPVDLTGYTARMQIRETVGSAAIIHTLDTTGGGIVLTSASGEIALTISDTDTAAFAFTKAVYDLELIDASGNVERLIEGTITLSTEVTR